MRMVLRKLVIVLGGAVGCLFVIDALLPVQTNIPYARIVTGRSGTVLHAYLAADGQWRMQATLAEITPELKKAIIYKEDKHFYHHPGINLISVCRALVNNLFRLRRTSGASTITMQVARMLSPKPRTYINKLIEMFRAVQLELHYSKGELLQLYLNLVPYGGNIQGVKAASLLYFGKTPDQLSLAELTALSIIPNRPNSLVMGRDNARIVHERNKWLQRFSEGNVFPQSAIDDALQEPLTAKRHNAPAGTPQLALHVKRANPGTATITTTLDGRMQQKAEEIVNNYMEPLKLQNINNAAVLIVDNNTRQVLTYIGSSDFGDRFHYGQVDGVRAVRSPGSTLKPLLYALAFSKGVITPKTVLADVPISIKGYSPENYDRLYRGKVTAEDALSNSLNIPAVKLLDDVGTAGFVRMLCDAGFLTIAAKQKEMGLSVILGGCGTTLEELTALYAAFASDGMYQPLQYTCSSATDTAISAAIRQGRFRLLSASANYMLTRVLCALHRPDLPNAYDEAMGIPRIAWKTGTSYGRKDAWSIGYNKRYTIGVWLGNFSGAGVPGLSGANTATPLLFRLFNAIDHGAANEWLDAPKETGFRLVCAETGLVPETFCQNQIMDYYIPGISATTRCQHLKETWLSADEKYSYCTACLPPNGYITKLLKYTPPELAAYYDATHTAYQRMPAHNPACMRTFQGTPPVITSLTNGMTYLVADKGQQLQLACRPAYDVQEVYWYINDKYYGSARAGEKLFFAAPTTTIKISCTDDKGRNTNIGITVKFI